MTLEAALLRPALLRPALRPVVDAILARVHRRRRLARQQSGEAALREAIRELLLPHPDERRVEARLELARACGARARDTALAEAMLARHRETREATRNKLHRSRRHPRRPAEASAGPVETRAAGTGLADAKLADNRR